MINLQADTVIVYRPEARILNALRSWLQSEKLESSQHGRRIKNHDADASHDVSRVYAHNLTRFPFGLDQGRVFRHRG